MSMIPLIILQSVILEDCFEISNRASSVILEIGLGVTVNWDRI
jgi:hypothetical protein